MNKRRFVFWYRAMLLLVGAIWNGWLCVTLGGFRSESIGAFLFEMVPVFALVAVARTIRSPAALVALALAHFGVMATSAADVMGSRSSTAPVAVVIATIASTAVVGTTAMAASAISRISRNS